jgi:hypothetical protein
VDIVVGCKRLELGEWGWGCCVAMWWIWRGRGGWTGMSYFGTFLSRHDVNMHGWRFKGRGVNLSYKLCSFF